MNYEEFKKFESDLKEKIDFYNEERKKWIQVSLIDSDIENLKEYSINCVEIYLKDSPSNHIILDEDTNSLNELFIKFLESRKEKLLK